LGGRNPATVRSRRLEPEGPWLKPEEDTPRIVCPPTGVAVTCCGRDRYSRSPYRPSRARAPVSFRPTTGCGWPACLAQVKEPIRCSQALPATTPPQQLTIAEKRFGINRKRCAERCFC
jgi:hypothetical protein